MMSCSGSSGVGGAEQSRCLPAPFEGMLSAGPMLNRPIYIKNREWLDGPDGDLEIKRCKNYSQIVFMLDQT